LKESRPARRLGFGNGDGGRRGRCGRSGSARCRCRCRSRNGSGGRLWLLGDGTKHERGGGSSLAVIRGEDCPLLARLGLALGRPPRLPFACHHLRFDVLRDGLRKCRGIRVVPSRSGVRPDRDQLDWSIDGSDDSLAGCRG
jgi:hypothetical protein